MDIVQGCNLPLLLKISSASLLPKIDQGSEGKISWQKLKQMLSCFDSSPWHFWQTGGREIKLSLEDSCFMFASETGKSRRVPILI